MTTETPAAGIVEAARHNLLYLIGAAAFKVDADKEAAVNCAEVLTDEITRLRAENAELRDTVRRVQSSARTLTATQKEIYDHYQKASKINTEAVATLDSEREANAILTAENAELQRKLDEAVNMLVRWQNWSCGQRGGSPFFDTRDLLTSIRGEA